MHRQIILERGRTEPVTPETVIAIQNQLRTRVRIEEQINVPVTVAGIDAGYNYTLNQIQAVVVRMDWQTLEVLESVAVWDSVSFPYVPGLLSFREIPAIRAALGSLAERPDLLMVDGHGIAHPRRLGIAAHLGVLEDLPAVGVAKSRLTGRYEEPGPDSGDLQPLFSGTRRHQEQIGVVLRSKKSCKPLFISPGHRITLAQALQFTLHCLKGYRLPEPTRVADRLSKLRCPGGPGIKLAD